MIPPNHNLLDPRLLEAEAIGLLDRMLAGLQDNNMCVKAVFSPHDNLLTNPSRSLIQ